MARRVRSRSRSRARRGAGLLGPRRVAYNPRTDTWIVIERQPDGRWKIIGNYEDQATAKEVAYAPARRLNIKGRHRRLSKLIDLSSPEAARKKLPELKRMYREAKTWRTKLRVYRALVAAANLAEIMARRKRNLSTKEREEFREIARLYREAAKEIGEDYRRNYSRLALALKWHLEGRRRVW